MTATEFQQTRAASGSQQLKILALLIVNLGRKCLFVKSSALKAIFHRLVGKYELVKCTKKRICCAHMHNECSTVSAAVMLLILIAPKMVYNL